MNPPDRLWLVILPTGERHLMIKEPLEGMGEWCRGLNATVAEYRLDAIVHKPKKKERKS